jgi:HD-GYP domain-containing protein (c-di-GMP phosphodiesterase class II)
MSRAAAENAPIYVYPRDARVRTASEEATTTRTRLPAVASLPQDGRSRDVLGKLSPVEDVIVSTDKLQLGMFVAELDRPWRETPFPIQGFLIVDRRQINQLRALCKEVLVDRARSAWYAVEFLLDRTPDKSASAVRFAGLVATSVAGQLGEHCIRNASAIHRMGVLRWWEQKIGRFFKRHAIVCPPKQRLAGIPDDLELVIYRDTKAIEDEIGPARKVYHQIEETMGLFMSELAAKREVSAETISVAASEMVESIAANPEAMIWLARMHAQNVRTYTHCVEVAIYMVTLGRHLGFPRDHLKNLCMTGLLLDVGLMQVDNVLLEKVEPLSESEVAEIRRHVGYSLDMLAKSPNIDRSVREGIAQHHERVDGSRLSAGSERSRDEHCRAHGGHRRHVCGTHSAATICGA